MAGLATWLLRAVCGVGGVAGLGLALLFFFQEKLLYVPKIPGVPSDYWMNPDRYGLEYEDVTIETEDKVKLHAWFLTGKGWSKQYIKSRPVILFFQENAGNMSFRLPVLKLMVERLQCSVYAVSYRGYGLSESKRPCELGLKKDATAALDSLLARGDVDPGSVIVFGRSLGGAVSIHLAAQQQYRVKALIVENAFTSVEDMVQRIVPPLGLLIGPGRPLNFLVTNKWHNLREIPKVKIPLLLMVSKLVSPLPRPFDALAGLGYPNSIAYAYLQDEMVPAQQMYQLHKAQRSEHCELVEFPTAHHMDAYDVSPQLYWGSMKEFIEKYVKASGQSTNGYL